jgi:hypothetical protein
MNKFILNFLMILTSTLICSELIGSEPCEVEFSEGPYGSCDSQQYSSHFRYFTVGTGPVLILPNVGVGFRGRNMRHGYDVSLSFSTIIQAHQLQALALYHYYFCAQRHAAWYAGIGPALSLFVVNSGRTAFAIAPDVSFGKQLSSSSNRREFIELHVQAPTWSRSEQLNIPLMYFKYGVEF